MGGRALFDRLEWANVALYSLGAIAASVMAIVGFTANLAQTLEYIERRWSRKKTTEEPLGPGSNEPRGPDGGPEPPSPGPGSLPAPPTPLIGCDWDATEARAPIVPRCAPGHAMRSRWAAV